MQQKIEEYKLDNDEILMYKVRIYVPNSQEFREMNNVPYVGHPGYHKTIVTIKRQYYSIVIKKYVVDFIAKCLACQKIKDENRQPTSLLQPFPILEWKWEVVIMNFITKLPRTSRQQDSIIIVVEKLIEASHFVPVNLPHKEDNIVDIYLKEIA